MFARLGRFCARTCSSEPPRDAPGLDFRVRNACFFDVFLCDELAMRNRSGCAKTTVFPAFFACRKLFAQARKRRRIAPRACRTELLTKIALKTPLVTRRTRCWKGLALSWAAFDRHLVGFWALLGSSWALLDASWPPLGHFLGALGHPFGVSTSLSIAQDTPKSILERFSFAFASNFA